MSEILASQATLPLAVFFPMTNPIQNYAWGSKTAMQQLFAIENPTNAPKPNCGWERIPMVVHVSRWQGNQLNCLTLLRKIHR